MRPAQQASWHGRFLVIKAALGDSAWRELLKREVGHQLALGKHGIIDDLIRDFERVLITRALQHTGGRRSRVIGNSISDA
jgi:hypothetical protein